MNLNRTALLRAAAVVAIAASVIAVAGPALSQPDSDNADPATSWQQRRHEHLQARLNHVAERLQITPAQQTAWTAYAGTVENLIGTKLARPAPDADAASVARFRAELAAERAQKLSQLADATAALRQVLSSEQQEILDRMARHHDRRMYRHGYRS